MTTKASKIKQVLSSEDKWTRGHFARNSNGEPCSIQGDYATCFCLMGACNKAIKLYCHDLLLHAVEKYSGKFRPIAEFNDDPETTFQDIQNVLNIMEELETNDQILDTP